MVRNAEQTAKQAEQTTTNDPGYCLQWSRERADIAALFPDASTAWRNAFHRHKGNRKPPRGAMCYWTGGSQGYGHIAVAIGNGKVRSTDAGGAGRVATIDLGWVESHWGLPYAGWADNVNDVEIPGVEGDDDMPLNDNDLKNIAHRVNLVLGDYKADGNQRDPSNKDPDQGNDRLTQIENVVRRLESKIDKLAK